MTRIRFFISVPHHEIEEHLLLGYVMRDTFMGTPREYYAVLMEWLCDCPPPRLMKRNPWS